MIFHDFTIILGVIHFELARLAAGTTADTFLQAHFEPKIVRIHAKSEKMNVSGCNLLP